MLTQLIQRGQDYLAATVEQSQKIAEQVVQTPQLQAAVLASSALESARSVFLFQQTIEKTRHENRKQVRELRRDLADFALGTAKMTSHAVAASADLLSVAWAAGAEVDQEYPFQESLIAACMATGALAFLDCPMKISSYAATRLGRGFYNAYAVLPEVVDPAMSGETSPWAEMASEANWAEARRKTILGAVELPLNLIFSVVARGSSSLFTKHLALRIVGPLLMGGTYSGISAHVQERVLYSLEGEESDEAPEWSWAAFGVGMFSALLGGAGKALGRRLFERFLSPAILGKRKLTAPNSLSPRPSSPPTARREETAPKKETGKHTRVPVIRFSGNLADMKDHELRGVLNTPADWSSPFVKGDWSTTPWTQRKPGEVHRVVWFYFSGAGAKNQPSMVHRWRRFREWSGQTMSLNDFESQYRHFQESGAFVALEKDFLRSLQKNPHLFSHAREAGVSSIDTSDAILPITKNQLVKTQKNYPEIPIPTRSDRDIVLRYKRRELSDSELNALKDELADIKHLSIKEAAKRTGYSHELIKVLRRDYPELALRHHYSDERKLEIGAYMAQSGEGNKKAATHFGLDPDNDRSNCRRAFELWLERNFTDKRRQAAWTFIDDKLKMGGLDKPNDEILQRASKFLKDSYHIDLHPRHLGYLYKQK